MSHRIAYYRVSTGDQSIEAQRAAISAGKTFDREYADEGISGATMAASRPEFSKLLEQVRSGDTVHVYAIDRLGRDALDVQATVRRLVDMGVTVDVHSIGPIGKGVGELIIAVLAQVADMERNRIRERTESGRVAARKALAETGKTHKGKHGLGRKPVEGHGDIAAWRKANAASISTTAKHFGISPATVKRYCAEAT
jgi:putative DNA-invertase from lambdoid prophage Rac